MEILFSRSGNRRNISFVYICACRNILSPLFACQTQARCFTVCKFRTCSSFFFLTFDVHKILNFSFDFIWPTFIDDEFLERTTGARVASQTNSGRRAPVKAIDSTLVFWDKKSRKFIEFYLNFICQHKSFLTSVAAWLRKLQRHV